jgi:hypothetical protein
MGGKQVVVADEIHEMLAAVVKLCSDGVRSMGDNVLLQNLLVRSKFLAHEVRYFRQVMTPLYQLLKTDMSKLETEANREAEDTASGGGGRGRNSKVSSASSDAFMAFMEDLIDCLFNIQADGSEKAQTQSQAVTSSASVQRFNRIVMLSSSVYHKLAYLSKSAAKMSAGDEKVDVATAAAAADTEGNQLMPLSSQEESSGSKTLEGPTGNGGDAVVEGEGAETDPFQDEDFSVFFASDANSSVASGHRDRALSSSFQQERNTYAIKALRRVNAKLEGLVGTSSSSQRKAPVTSTSLPFAAGHSTGALTVEQQTDWLIHEATSKENLARMYEGWTPWL